MRCGIFFLVLTLCVQNITPFLPSAHASAPTVKKDQPAISSSELVQNFDIPKSLGSVDRRFAGRADQPVIFYIQDAHAVGAAQQSIKGLIEHLHREYAVETVAAEGVEGDFDTVFFRAFPDTEKLENVLGGYVASGELAGAAAAAMLSEQPLRIAGLESQKIYLQGVAAYLDAMEKRDSALPSLKKLAEDLNRLKQKNYSAEARAFDEKMQAWRKDSAALPVLLRHLFAILTPDPVQDPALTAIAESLKQEEAQNTEAALRMLEDLAAKLKPSLKNGEVNAEFQRHLQDFRTQRLSAGAFAAYLESLEIKTEDPAIQAVQTQAAPLARAHRLLSAIKGDAFVKELDAYLAKAAEQIFKTAAEKQIYEFDRALERLNNFANLELTPQTSQMQIAAPAGKNGGLAMTEWIESFNRALNQDAFAPHRRFYELAKQRDEIFFEKIEQLIRKDKPRAIVLVTGGFHVPILEQKLQAAGISHARIMPYLESVPEETPYRDYMRGAVSWSSYFRPEGGRIDLGAAFARAVRDRLLEKTEREDGLSAHILLREWREEIVRRMFAAGRIAAAPQLTRFLDETAANKERYSAGLKNIERFLDYVRGLDKTHQLNEQTLAQWWARPANVQPYAYPQGFIPVSLVRGGVFAAAKSEVRTDEPAAKPASEEKLAAAMTLIRSRAEELGKDSPLGQMLSQLETLRIDAHDLNGLGGMDPESKTIYPPLGLTWTTKELADWLILAGVTLQNWGKTGATVESNLSEADPIMQQLKPAAETVSDDINPADVMDWIGPAAPVIVNGPRFEEKRKEVGEQSLHAWPRYTLEEAKKTVTEQAFKFKTLFNDLTFRIAASVFGLAWFVKIFSHFWFGAPTTVGEHAPIFFSTQIVHAPKIYWLLFNADYSYDLNHHYVGTPSQFVMAIFLALILNGYHNIGMGKSPYPTLFSKVLNGLILGAASGNVIEAVLTGKATNMIRMAAGRMVAIANVEDFVLFVGAPIMIVYGLVWLAGELIGPFIKKRAKNQTDDFDDDYLSRSEVRAGGLDPNWITQQYGPQLLNLMRDYSAGRKRRGQDLLDWVEEVIYPVAHGLDVTDLIQPDARLTDLDIARLQLALHDRLFLPNNFIVQAAPAGLNVGRIVKTERAITQWGRDIPVYIVETLNGAFNQGNAAPHHIVRPIEAERQWEPRVPEYQEIARRIKAGNVKLPSFAEKPEMLTGRVVFHLLGDLPAEEGIRRIRAVDIAEELSHSDILFFIEKLWGHQPRLNEQAKAAREFLKRSSSLIKILDRAGREEEEMGEAVIEVEAKLQALSEPNGSALYALAEFFTGILMPAPQGSGFSRMYLLAHEQLIRLLGIQLFGKPSVDGREWMEFLEKEIENFDALEARLRAAADAVYAEEFLSREELGQRLEQSAALAQAPAPVAEEVVPAVTREQRGALDNLARNVERSADGDETRFTRLLADSSLESLARKQSIDLAALFPGQKTEEIASLTLRVLRGQKISLRSEVRTPAKMKQEFLIHARAAAEKKYGSVRESIKPLIAATGATEGTIRYWFEPRGKKNTLTGKRKKPTIGWKYTAKLARHLTGEQNPFEAVSILLQMPGMDKGDLSEIWSDIPAGTGQEVPWPKDYREGKITFKALAQKYQRANLDKAGKKKAQASFMKNLFLRLYEQGWTINQVAAEMGMNARTMTWWADAGQYLNGEGGTEQVWQEASMPWARVEQLVKLVKLAGVKSSSPHARAAAVLGAPALDPEIVQSYFELRNGNGRENEAAKPAKASETKKRAKKAPGVPWPADYREGKINFKRLAKKYQREDLNKEDKKDAQARFLKNTFLHLYEQGWTINEIAAEMGMSTYMMTWWSMAGQYQNENGQRVWQQATIPWHRVEQLVKLVKVKGVKSRDPHVRAAALLGAKGLNPEIVQSYFELRNGNGVVEEAAAEKPAPAKAKRKKSAAAREVPWPPAYREGQIHFKVLAKKYRRGDLDREDKKDVQALFFENIFLRLYEQGWTMNDVAEAMGGMSTYTITWWAKTGQFLNGEEGKPQVWQKASLPWRRVEQLVRLVKIPGVKSSNPGVRAAALLGVPGLDPAIVQSYFELAGIKRSEVRQHGYGTATVEEVLQSPRFRTLRFDRNDILPAALRPVDYDARRQTLIDLIRQPVPQLAKYQTDLEKILGALKLEDQQKIIAAMDPRMILTLHVILHAMVDRFKIQFVETETGLFKTNGHHRASLILPDKNNYYTLLIPLKDGNDLFNDEERAVIMAYDIVFAAALSQGLNGAQADAFAWAFTGGYSFFYFSKMDTVLRKYERMVTDITQAGAPQTHLTRLQINGRMLELAEGDITVQTTDAIVNPSNPKLLFGIGVGGHILRRGGGQIESDAAEKAPIEPGAAVSTKGGTLKAKYVIHTAVSDMKLTADLEVVRKATRSVLEEADKLKIASVSFPSFGTGVIGIPYNDSAEVMISEIEKYLKEKTDTSLQHVRLVLYGQEAYQAYTEVLSSRPRSEVRNVVTMPEGSKRYFDEENHWIKTEDPLGHLTDELTWQKGRLVQIRTRASDGSFIALKEQNDHLVHEAWHEPLDGGRPKVYLSFDPGLDINRLALIPLAHIESIPLPRGSAPAIFRILSLLAQDQKIPHLIYAGGMISKIPSDQLFNSLSEAMVPEATVLDPRLPERLIAMQRRDLLYLFTFQRGTSSLETSEEALHDPVRAEFLMTPETVLWKPAPFERLFVESKAGPASLDIRDGKIQRVFWGHQSYVSDEFLTGNDIGKIEKLVPHGDTVQGFAFDRHAFTVNKQGQFLFEREADSRSEVRTAAKMKQIFLVRAEAIAEIKYGSKKQSIKPLEKATGATGSTIRYWFERRGKKNNLTGKRVKPTIGWSYASKLARHLTGKSDPVEAINAVYDAEFTKTDLREIWSDIPAGTGQEVPWPKDYREGKITFKALAQKYQAADLDKAGKKKAQARFMKNIFLRLYEQGWTINQIAA